MNRKRRSNTSDEDFQPRRQRNPPKRTRKTKKRSGSKNQDIKKSQHQHKYNLRSLNPYPHESSSVEYVNTMRVDTGNLLQQNEIQSQPQHSLFQDGNIIPPSDVVIHVSDVSIVTDPTRSNITLMADEENSSSNEVPVDAEKSSENTDDSIKAENEPKKTNAVPIDENSTQAEIIEKTSSESGENSTVPVDGDKDQGTSSETAVEKDTVELSAHLSQISVSMPSSSDDVAANPVTTDNIEPNPGEQFDNFIDIAGYVPEYGPTDNLPPVENTQFDDIFK